jgi:hypothetical protein
MHDRNPNGRAAGIATLALLAGATLPRLVAAAQLQDYRGGWETDVGGQHQVYEFVIADERVTGIYCSECTDIRTLAFVEGHYGPDGLDFTVNHVRADGSTEYREQAHATADQGELVVKGRRDGQEGTGFEWRMHRDPRGAAPILLGPRPPPPVYRQPGPWQLATEDRVLGTWFAGAGANKQYFHFRKVGERLLGMVCGPCDNPYTMAALQDIFLMGDTLVFHIAHQDWGAGTLPYENIIVAHVARNELRMDALQSNMQRTFSMTLIGPARSGDER